MLRIHKITHHHVVDFAAEELKKYLRMMMPRCGEIPIDAPSDGADNAEGFRLGLMRDLGLPTDDAEDLTLDDILYFDVDEHGNGVIAGSNPRSVLLAVYRYLKANGCRWLFPGVDGEWIPVKPIEAVSYRKMADCRFRGQCNEGAEFQQNMLEAIDFTPKLGMNVFMQEFDNPKAYYDSYYDHKYNESNFPPEPLSEETVLQWKRQCESEISKRGLQYHDMGHGWTAEPYGINSSLGWKASGKDAVPAEAVQYLAMLDGERKLYMDVPLNTNICMSNPEARAKWVQSVADYAALNTNVDYLHVWLADYYNNHCECPVCRTKPVTDWYILLMNEIDGELTRRGLDTRIVFICYYETIWKSETVNIEHPKRFTMLFAPITRAYYRAVTPTDKPFRRVPFVHNRITLPRDIDEYIPYAKESMAQYGVDTFLYEYHFCHNQYFNPGCMRYARILHEDVKGYRAHGFHGIIEDGSQRSYFPNGLCFTVYAETLFDLSVSFDELCDDYLRHAYGEDYRAVRDFLERIGGIVPQAFLAGKATKDPAVHNLYDPEMAPRLRALKAEIEDFRPFVDAHRRMPKRAETVSMRLLSDYLDFWSGIAEPLALKCTGTNEREAALRFYEFFEDFGKREYEIRTCYDHCNVGYAFASRYFHGSPTNIPE